MNVDFLYMLMLLVSVSLMMAQLLVKNKRSVHIVFAIFCASLSMVALQHLTQQSLGMYALVIGFGACATCNAFWLVSRALFRQENVISMRHIALAALIAVLVVISQALKLAGEISPAFIAEAASYRISLSEVVNLLSSAILVLTFWEAGRGFSKASRVEKCQRLLFMYAFSSGVFLCMVVAEALVPAHLQKEVFPWLVAFSATQMMLVTQLIIYWRNKYWRNKQFETRQKNNHVHTNKVQCNAQEEKVAQSGIVEAQTFDYGLLPKQLRSLLLDERLYLQSGLKILDIAKRLQVSEYKVSRLIRFHYHDANFNQLVNRLRIEHAIDLLEDPEKQHWSILVIGLESGFASIGPFNRAFKAKHACSPNEYRQRFLSNLKNLQTI